MTDEPLIHNPLNGVTAGVWKRGDVVHKVLTRRREAPPHWASSEDPRHWNYWRREALVSASGLPERLGLRAPHLLEMVELTSAYLEGLREAGWDGDARLVRLGICASGVKYEWLTAFCLEHARADEHLDYGRDTSVDAGERYAARAAGLALCASWAREAEILAAALGL